MAELSRFFNSIDHDRQYSAADWAAFFATFIGNGVMPLPSNQLKVSAGSGSGLSLSVAPGNAFVNGYSYQLTEALEKTLSTADGSNPRKDRVVVRFSRSDRSIYVAVKTGTAAATPTAPALNQSGDTYELSLATITVARGATSISASAIQDDRGDSDLCGFCAWHFSENGSDNYDDFWAQFQAQFNDWMDSLEDQLDPATAAGIAAKLVQLTPVDISLTLPSSGWAQDANGVWNILIPASSITHEVDGSTVQYPVGDATAAYADVDMSGATASTAEALLQNWSLVGRCWVDSSGFHASCYGAAPSAALPIILRLVDKG